MPVPGPWSSPDDEGALEAFELSDLGDVEIGALRSYETELAMLLSEDDVSAVAAAVEGALTASCPGSVLQLHPHVTLVVDEAAGARLSRADHYRYVLSHKLAGQGW